MKKKSLDLPQDLWTQIFEQLDERDLEDLSLVSKQFLSITNPLKKSIKILDKTLPSLPGILRRFPYLESITFCAIYRDSYTEILRQLLHSRLHGEGMINLKRISVGLVVDNCLGYHYHDVIADLFPWLEEISFPRFASLTDCELQNLQKKLTFLKKVRFRWNDKQFPSNESLISLSLNCLNLEEINIKYCFGFFSEDTIGYIMRHSPKLTTLKLPKLKRHPKATLSIQNSIAYAKNLHTFCSYSKTITEQVLRSFVEANPPLQKFKINYSRQKLYSFDGKMKTTNLLLLFQACSSIHHLSLWENRWLSDSCVKKISQVLTKLTHINLSYCTELTTESFFILTQKCPFLQEIKMENTRIGASKVSSTDFQKHKKIRYLNLSQNKYLDDKTVINILLVCPDLQSIDISGCSRLTEEGVWGILKTCVLLTELKIAYQDNVSNIVGEYFEGKTIGLKVLDAWKTTMDDKALGEIGKICPRLEHLDIAYCEGVTNIGVIEVVKNCKKLKKINIHECPNLEMDILGDKLKSISKALKFK